MKLIPAIIVFSLLCATQIHGKSIIHRVSRTDFDNRAQVIIYFDKLPQFEEFAATNRLDLTLAETTYDENIPLLSTDETIIKSRISTQGDDTILSLFFRYHPQKVRVSKETANSLVVEIMPGNEFTEMYKRFVENLQTTFISVEKPVHPENPLLHSHYKDDWASFFSPSYAPLPIIPPLFVFIPSYPWVDLLGLRSGKYDISHRPTNEMTPPEWLTMLTNVQSLLNQTSDDGEKSFLLLLHADILFRIGNVRASTLQLDLLSETYPEERIGIVSRYLKYLLIANSVTYHLVRTGLHRLAEPMDQAHPLKPYLDLALFEVDLAVGKVDVPVTALELPSQGNEELHLRAALRTADALYQTGQFSTAILQYEKAGRDSPFTNLPFSLYGYCSTLHQQQVWQESTTCFQELATLLIDDEQRGAALYNAAVATASADDQTGTEQMLRLVRMDYPQSKAAARAQMLSADRCIDRDIRCMGTALNDYSKLSTNEHYRDIASEAQFKKALIYHLRGNNRECVHELMTLKRRFQSSDIKHHADALLIQVVPTVIREMLSSGNGLQAITLARQNRQLFDNRWLDLSLLNEFLPVFERNGLYREALTLQLFLMEQGADTDRQKSYLTLTRLASREGNLNLVEDFSSQYFRSYPSGRYHTDFLYFRIDALYRYGDVERAQALLPTPLPDRKELILLAASIYYQLDAFDKSAALLGRIPRGVLPETHLFILADSLYNIGKIDKAKTCFLLIDDNSELQSVALLRLAEIERKFFSPATARSLLQKLADTEEPTAWQRYASHQLRFDQQMTIQ